MTATYAGTTLLDEIYALRRHLATDRIATLERELRHGATGEAARARLSMEASRLRFRLTAFDHLLDVFRLHDAGSVSVAIGQELQRLRRERAGLISDAQVAAIGRMRLRTLAVERQVACIYAAYVLVESDVLRVSEFPLPEVEFEALDARFARWQPVWEREVAPVLAAFCRSHSRDDDRRLRSALADYVTQIRLAEALRAPLVRRVAAMPPMKSDPLAVRHLDRPSAIA